MAISATKVALGDGKPAIRVDGLPISPAYFRVKRMQIESTNYQEGVALNVVLKAQAYEVDSAGVVVLDADSNPIKGGITKTSIVGDSLASGAVNLQSEWKALAKRALQKLVRSQEFVGYANSAPSDLTDDSV